MKEIKIPQMGAAVTVVTPLNTAKAVGSGSLPVFATPMMIALMEEAAVNAIAPFLEEDETTVGGKISVSHMSATAIGREVTATAEITEVVANRIVFSVTAKDDKGDIGSGTHTRFLVKAEAFVERAEKK